MTTKEEINSICYELDSIIRELESIASGIESSFQGIGQEKCAASIRVQINKYRKAKEKLNNVDPSLLVAGWETISGA
ncbi:hypothetical protein SD457_11590 [Coprobacillaceae bacterium CR2/5/TPMF4]|nr:hypothetical protein SD457_11590 [Coprobacillaceae bacterium CR2/5/TPMF4]